MRIIIIGCSIAGSAAALSLSKQAEVAVYEQKPIKKVGGKLCMNNVTPSFFDYTRKLGIDPRPFVVSKIEKANFYSENNQVSFRTKEFRINRQKLIESLIKNAEKNNVEFNFNTCLVDFKKSEGYFHLILEKNGKKIFDTCDVLIAADGALSNIARKIGIKKKLLLAMQAEVSFNQLKLDKKSYHVYLRKIFGYYNWVFPSKNCWIVGLVDEISKAKQSFENFSSFLKIKPGKIKAALIPEPKFMPSINNIFLIGDAGNNIKFSGGGIVPSLMAATALRTAVKGDFKELKNLEKKISLNSIMLSFFKKMHNKDWNSLLKILKSKKFYNILEERDNLSKKDLYRLADLRFIRFLPKLV